MSAKNVSKQPIVLVKTALNTIFTNPSILFPFCIVAFIQLLILEIFFFAPRYPLNTIFGPIITRVYGDLYLHYPNNFVLLAKSFYHKYLQLGLYVLFNSFFIGCMVLIISRINQDRKVNIGEIFRRAWGSYIHLVTAALISVGTVGGVTYLHDMLINRAALIRSTSGKFFYLKQAVFFSAPYINFLVSILVTAIFAFVIPVIMLEKKRILAALIENFKLLFRSFWLVLSIVLLPALLYIPVLLIKTSNSNSMISNGIVPEFLGGILIFNILFLLFIEAIQCTAVTLFYLLQKEES